LNKALVSVIVPAYNAATTIRQTLNSVLAQTYQEFEVITVDDGSSDTTSAIVEEFAAKDARFQFVRQSNAGVGAARNTAIGKADGKYIAPLDADDLWFPEKLEKQVACLEEGGDETGLVYCWSSPIDQYAGLAGDCSHTVEGRLRRALILRNVVGNGSAPAFRATALEKVGLYLTRAEQGGAQGCEDWDLYLRISEQFGIRVVPEYLTAYRQSGFRMSVSVDTMATSFAVMMLRARERNWDLPSSIFRWSAGHFYAYLAQNAYHSGHHVRSLRRLKEAARADPALLLTTGAYKIFVGSVLNLIRGTRGKDPISGVLPSLPKETGKGPCIESRENRKHPFLSNRIFKQIERARWYAALRDGA
jgi:glycosyltransferase involved in cell wall biosynthesis